MWFDRFVQEPGQLSSLQDVAAFSVATATVFTPDAASERDTDTQRDKGGRNTAHIITKNVWDTFLFLLLLLYSPTEVLEWDRLN